MTFKRVGLGVLLIALIFAAIVGMRVLGTSSAIVAKTTNADEILNNYELFHDLHEKYGQRLLDASQTKYMLEEAKKEGDKDETYRLRTEFAGQVQVCRNIAAKYNAASNKVHRGAFKGWSLPEHLDVAACG
jgi:hypothetical protein